MSHLKSTQVEVRQFWYSDTILKTTPLKSNNLIFYNALKFSEKISSFFTKNFFFSFPDCSDSIAWFFKQSFLLTVLKLLKILPIICQKLGKII